MDRRLYDTGQTTSPKNVIFWRSLPIPKINLVLREVLRGVIYGCGGNSRLIACDAVRIRFEPLSLVP